MTTRAPVFAGLMLSVSCTSCVPWTVRPLEGSNTVSSASVAANPAAYVDSIWSTKLLPAILNAAVDARELLGPDAVARHGRREGSGPAFFLVRGEGKVTAVDQKSRNGLALVDLAPYDGQPDITIQIGPVLRGTALRDATGLIRFNDFVNQLQFADVANELNDRVLRTVLAGIDPSKLAGRRVSFAGVTAAELPLRGIVPVEFRVLETGK